jgi:hypothetical protein
MRAVPRFLLVTVHNTTPQSLYDLLAAIDPDTPKVCQALQLMATIGNMASLIFVGNSDLNTTTRWGVELQAGTIYELPSVDANLIHLDQIYVATDGVDITLGCAIVTR